MKLQIKTLRNQEINENKIILKTFLYELIAPYINKNAIHEIDRIYNNMNEFTKDNTAIIIGALDDNSLIGFVWSYIKKENTKIAHVNYFFIKDNYRSKGIGEILIKKLQEKLSLINVKEIELLVDIVNERAIKFYTKQGFSIKEKKEKKLKLVKQIYYKK